MFEKAKFRDLYLTRDSRKAVFIKAHFYSDLDTNLYEFMIEDGTWISVTSDGLVDYESSTQHPSDIISKYKEDIDEAELNELAKESKNYIRMFSSAPHVLKMMITYEEGFKNGYRKAKEE